jgi:hypothetical protein
MSAHDKNLVSQTYISGHVARAQSANTLIDIAAFLETSNIEPANTRTSVTDIVTITIAWVAFIALIMFPALQIAMVAVGATLLILRAVLRRLSNPPQKFGGADLSQIYFLT